MLDSLLEALGYVGSSLDKPGRAVRGLLSGKLDEGLAAVPFSDSLGLTDESRRTSGRDLLAGVGLDPGDGALGHLAGMGAEIATDPLTLGGAAAGRVLGRAAEGAAVARGPRYGTTADDLTRMLGEYQQAQGLSEGSALAGRRVQNVLGYPESARLLSEIPGGSKILGAGAEGLAMSTPAGDVLRVGRTLGEAPGRPVSENVLQATRAVDVPAGARNMRVERTPWAGAVDEAGYAAARPGLDAGLGAEGLAFADAKAGNVGAVGGRPVVIDPGAVEPTAGFAGGYQPVARAADPSRGMGALLDALGGDAAVRRALDAGRASPELARLLAGYGGFAGADLGAWGRTQTGR